MPHVPAGAASTRAYLPTGIALAHLILAFEFAPSEKEIVWRLGGVASPSVKGSTSAKPETLEEIRSRSDSPVVVFPECTTSNGRALLRFADVFGNVRLPVMQYKVFVMCVR